MNNQIRNPERWAKRRAERQQRRHRANRQQRGSYYFGNFKVQLMRVGDAADAINGAAAVKHTAAGRGMDSFVPLIDTGAAARACKKRITRFYGLGNKCVTSPGYRK